jgi:hypothetical protein
MRTDEGRIVIIPTFHRGSICMSLSGEAHRLKMQLALDKSLAIVAAFANIDVYQAYPSGVTYSGPGIVGRIVGRGRGILCY